MRLTIDIPDSAHETLVMLIERQGVSVDELAAGFVLAGLSGATVLRAAGFHLSGEEGLQHYFDALEAAKPE